MEITASGPDRRRDVAALSLFGVALLVAHQIGLRAITPDSPLSPVWPTSGVMLGAFILLPRRLWPAALAITVAVDALSNLVAGVRIHIGLAYLGASLVELAVGLWVVDRISGMGISFRRIRDTFAILAAAVSSAAVSGVAAGMLAAWTSDTTFSSSFATWWTADVLGVLLLAPLILGWARGGKLPPALRTTRFAEGALFLVLWTWSAYHIFQGHLTLGWFRLHPYMLASLMVWASFRLGIRGVTAAMSTVAVVAIGVSLRGADVFPLGGSSLAEQLLLVQVFLVVMGVTGLLLASSLAESRAAANEAREGADRLRVLGDNLHNGVIFQLIREPDGRQRFLHLSASAERVLGVSPDAVMRDPANLARRFATGDLARISAAQTASARDLSDISVETRVPAADGRDRWIMVSATPRPLDEGRTVWDGVAIDITDRRHDEDRLRQANRALRMISHCNQVLVRAPSEERLLAEICEVIVREGGFLRAAVCFADAEASDGVRPVASAVRDAGRSRDGLLADHPSTHGAVQHTAGEQPSQTRSVPAAEALQARTLVVYQDLMNDPRAAAWRGDAATVGCRAAVAIPLREGDVVLGALTVYAADVGVFDPHETARLTELADDVGFGIAALRSRAEQARAEAALASSEERFRQLAENIREIFWMIDTRTGALLYISPSVERLYGVPASVLVASPEFGLERIHPGDRDRVLRASAAVRQGGVFDEVYRVVHVNGTVHWVHGRAFPVRDAAGEVYRFVGVSDDITARKRIEEQLRQVQKLEAIGQLAGGVAHDFNNILAAIMMQAGMARGVPGAPRELDDLLQDIEASAQRASNLTRQLLLFSRKQAIQERQVELNDLVADLVRMLRRVVPEHVRLHLAMHPRKLAVTADPGMLEQVIMNLTVNARDAMPDGGELWIETFSRELSDDEVRTTPGARGGVYAGVRVRDSGTGIAPEHRPHIFDPFFTTKEPGKGTGLGLATVFGIVQQHRGAVSLQSEVGRGTTVEVLLPITATPVSAPEVEPAPVPVPRRGQQTILVVEDDHAVRVMTRRILERQGFTVHTAGSGREALDAWSRYEPRIDLLLTDMVMPEGVGGAELAGTLQARDPQLRVIYSSGYDPDHASHALRLEPGVNFLQKPASSRQIVDAVVQMLQDD